MAISSGAEMEQLIGEVSELQGWFLPWPERTALGLSLEPSGRGCVRDTQQLGPERGHQGQGQPLGLLGTATALGPAPQRLPL